MTTYYSYVESPIDRLLLTSDGKSLTGLLFADGRTVPADDWVQDDDATPFPEVRSQLLAYFAGERTDFELPLAAVGTEFQRRVWDELLRIPYGATISYGELAARIGNPKASRAVGLANGSNPISIIIPCHRVIGSNGKLTGYGGGLPRKVRLLAIEGMAAR